MSIREWVTWPAEFNSKWVTLGRMVIFGLQGKLRKFICVLLCTSPWGKARERQTEGRKDRGSTPSKAKQRIRRERKEKPVQSLNSVRNLNCRKLTTSATCNAFSFFAHFFFPHVSSDLLDRKVVSNNQECSDFSSFPPAFRLLRHLTRSVKNELAPSIGLRSSFYERMKPYTPFFLLLAHACPVDESNRGNTFLPLRTRALSLCRLWCLSFSFTHLCFVYSSLTRRLGARRLTFLLSIWFQGPFFEAPSGSAQLIHRLAGSTKEDGRTKKQDRRRWLFQSAGRTFKKRKLIEFLVLICISFGAFHLSASGFHKLCLHSVQGGRRNREN